MPKNISYAEGKIFAESYNMLYFEGSAKENINVKATFITIMDAILDSNKTENPRQNLPEIKFNLDPYLKKLYRATFYKNHVFFVRRTGDNNNLEVDFQLCDFNLEDEKLSIQGIDF